MNKKRNNKGFSLVELIVVIAVMAVLVVVLAPAYLRYVDKARLQKDESAVAEVVQAIKIAAAEEAVSDEISDGVSVVLTYDSTAKAHAIIVKASDTDKETVTYASNKFTYADEKELGKEIRATVGDSLTLSSSDLKTVATITLTVTQDTDSRAITVTCDNANITLK